MGVLAREYRAARQHRCCCGARHGKLLVQARQLDFWYDSTHPTLSAGMPPIVYRTAMPVMPALDVPESEWEAPQSATCDSPMR